MKKLSMILLASLGFTLVSTNASAWLESKQFRLHLETNLLEVGTGERNPDNNANDENYGGVEVGVGMTKGAVGFGVTLGKGFVLGGRVALGQEAYNWDPRSSGEAFYWSVVPYLEYVWLTGLVRPFVKIYVGMEGMMDGNYDFWGLTTGGGGGVHFFVFDNLSLDANADLGFRFGGGDWDNNAGNDFSHWRFNFALFFGISAWF